MLLDIAVDMVLMLFEKLDALNCPRAGLPQQDDANGHCHAGCELQPDLSYAGTDGTQRRRMT
jgi:hypothetical protein